MEVILDTREPADFRKKIIKEFPNIKFKEVALKEGDILIHCENEGSMKVLVERKTVADLYGSVMGSKGKKPRFPSQCARLTTHQTDSVVILLVSGDITEYCNYMKRVKHVDIKPEIFDSIIASVMVRYNIRVLVDNDHLNGVKRSIKVGMKICEGNLDIVAQRNLDALISRFLNITMIQWSNIRKMYGTDLTYIANVADLTKVQGIGKVKERNIKNILIGKSNDWL
jgi:ERCC4-type nuclease